ncbi:NADH-dependent flavin oxidoreductase [Dellaglioa sp. P0083]|uniref:NADH-dependent flavin oxidoreductase n=1 Tax=Dellaglioa kimchii TaxID=3344667 RepID=UPI0038D4BECA
MTKKMTDTFRFRRGLELKNRILMAPMTVKMSYYDEVVTHDESDYYALHSGEVGAVITAATSVQANGKGWEGSLAIYDDKFIPGLTRLASAIKKNGTKAILQIFHAGRMTNSTVLRGQSPVSASAVAAERPDAEIPKALSETEILELIESFKSATKRAIKAGFDGVELHGANTYLLQQFFSPHSNRRDDAWGGTLEKRFKFINDVVDGVIESVDQSGVKDFIVGYRFSPEEYEKPGISMEDSIILIDKLADKKLDYLHISLGKYNSVSRNTNFNEKSRMAYVQEKINGRVPLIGVGDVRTREDVNGVLANADLVAVGRSLLIDPKWTSKLLNGQEETIKRTLAKNDREKLMVSDGAVEFLRDMMPERLVD